MDFIVENAAGIIAVLFALHALAVAVVNLTDTPSEKADPWLNYIYKGIEFLAGLVTEKAKEKGDEDEVNTDSSG